MDNKFSRLNQYRSMWVLVFFDLPTDTRKNRKVAASFRKSLLTDGFEMFNSLFMYVTVPVGKMPKFTSSVLKKPSLKKER